MRKVWAKQTWQHHSSKRPECLSKHVFTADRLAAVRRRHSANGLLAVKKAICPSLMFYLWQNSEKGRRITVRNKATECHLTCKEQGGVFFFLSIVVQNHNQANMLQDFPWSRLKCPLVVKAGISEHSELCKKVFACILFLCCLNIHLFVICSLQVLVWVFSSICAVQPKSHLGDFLRHLFCLRINFWQSTGSDPRSPWR